MLTDKTLLRYFAALQTRDGALAASLFAFDGVIDDFRGRRHSGAQAIRGFIGQVPVMQLEYLTEFMIQGPRATVYGRITYPGVESVLVRWVFSASGDADRIAHLCNSRIELVPAEFLLPSPRDAAPVPGLQ